MLNHSPLEYTIKTHWQTFQAIIWKINLDILILGDVFAEIQKGEKIAFEVQQAIMF